MRRQSFMSQFNREFYLSGLEPAKLRQRQRNLLAAGAIVLLLLNLTALACGSGPKPRRIFPQPAGAPHVSAPNLVSPVASPPQPRKPVNPNHQTP